MEGGAHRSPYTYYDPCYCALQQLRLAAEAAPKGCRHKACLRRLQTCVTGASGGQHCVNLRGQVLWSITVRPFRRL